MNSNPDQGDRSLEEKAHVITGAGKARVNTDFTLSGSTLADGSFMASDNSVQGTPLRPQQSAFLNLATAINDNQMFIPEVKRGRNGKIDNRINPRSRSTSLTIGSRRVKFNLKSKGMDLKSGIKQEAARKRRSSSRIKLNMS